MEGAMPHLKQISDSLRSALPIRWDIAPAPVPYPEALARMETEVAAMLRDLVAAEREELEGLGTTQVLLKRPGVAGVARLRTPRGWAPRRDRPFRGSVRTRAPPGRLRHPAIRV